MKLKISRVFDAMQALNAIIGEKRPIPQMGKFRLARMHAKLLPEFVTANAQREELITRHSQGAMNTDGQVWVPPERLSEFNAEWEPIAETEIDVDIAPVRIVELIVDGAANGGVEAGELILLGDLVTE
jgi:hypothetical protein